METTNRVRLTREEIQLKVYLTRLRNLEIRMAENKPLTGKDLAVMKTLEAKLRANPVAQRELMKRRAIEPAFARTADCTNLQRVKPLLRTYLGQSDVQTLRRNSFGKASEATQGADEAGTP